MKMAPEIEFATSGTGIYIDSAPHSGLHPLGPLTFQSMACASNSVVPQVMTQSVRKHPGQKAGS